MSPEEIRKFALECAIQITRQTGGDERSVLRAARALEAYMVTGETKPPSPDLKEVA